MTRFAWESAGKEVLQGEFILPTRGLLLGLFSPRPAIITLDIGMVMQSRSGGGGSVKRELLQCQKSPITEFTRCQW